MITFDIHPWRLAWTLLWAAIGVYWFGWWFLLPALMLAVEFNPHTGE